MILEIKNKTTLLLTHYEIFKITLLFLTAFLFSNFTAVAQVEEEEEITFKKI